ALIVCNSPQATRVSTCHDPINGFSSGWKTYTFPDSFLLPFSTSAKIVAVVPCGTSASTVSIPDLSMEMPFTAGSMDQVTLAFSGNDGPSGVGYMTCIWRDVPAAISIGPIDAF